ncbi:hypothetical protein LWI28_007060 [Acer negundo]|uniref:Protein NO VEIN C-terminal domain-containing protein n=1 Tax=Acer negundo TaxID=4023 RepID=A0AAD5JIY8_ACENE|nr:hypothetical protein LWI28_007060 [Acer negundo]
MRKVCTYFEFDHDDILSKDWSPVKNIFILLKKLCTCETWLAEQFNVKEFKSLGYGEFFLFLEKHASLLPSELQKLLAGNMCEKSSFEVSLLQHLLVVLISQASNSLGENETITKQMINTLLIRQFPLLCFKIMDNGSMDSFLEIVGKYRNDVISKCVLFSETLLGMSTHKENTLLETHEVIIDSGVRTRMSESVTSKDAVEVLLRAPMLSDLNSWSHWDLLFSPSLGPLLEWLLNEVNEKELLCLVTKDGKVIRLDSTATVDSFFEAALEGSSFQTAVKLLSSFALAGGEKHVPLSLLKCHARHAFEVILKNNMERSDDQDPLMHDRVLRRQHMVGEVSVDKLSGDASKHFIKRNKAETVASRFFIDCLGYLPSEFRGYAADVLLSGLRSVILDVPLEILRECNQTEQRLMLHEVGLSLGIVEWINDYHAFCSATSTDSLLSCGASCLKAARSEFSTGSICTQNASDEVAFIEGEMIKFAGADGCKKECSEVCHTIDGVEASSDGIGNCCTQLLSEIDSCKDGALIIESIRREEFGLDSSLSNVQSSLLKKQHTRLGRALYCLSRELYSQDSHFLLELVQNADDNMYPDNAEPTLTFILQESGITVLNNELGFSARNIRALCDVGNSTKKGSGAGYIGKKGIGFKSVFRVTDAPEIHSNGFHVKFDISEGQIGFVLPTVVSPCNIAMLSRLASKDPILLDNSCWNTCIRLPFRSKLSEGIIINNIIAMFSDLHPSLLLFLHRLQCIVFRNMLNDSLIVMRKEMVGNGIIKVSCGEEKMTWFVASKKLQADVMRSDVQTTEIAIAFTLQETNGNYRPLLNQQPVFAFLPLRTYGLKFILQGDFVLPSSREEVDGNSPWNQWLLPEFPGLFVSAEKSFCDLPCFRENPAKAVAAFMSFVPLVGEVHGFFSRLPRMIISKLRMSNCLLLEGDNNHWVPPCKVLRGWNDEARNLLPNSLLHDHLGFGFLNKDIVLSDTLARALGIEEYGAKFLLQIIASLCRTENGLKSMGLSWLSSWLNALYTISFHSPGQSGIEADIISKLQKIPFIPLSDGTFSSVDEGTLWLHSDGSGVDGGLEAFPHLYCKLRTVSPALLSASVVDISCLNGTSVDNLTRMLLKIGVQQLSAHDIVKVHILPAISDDTNVNRGKYLMIDYLCFVMIHLQSSCPNCHVEREFIVSEIRNKAFILTNHGYKRSTEVSIHFGKEFGNPVDPNKLINSLDIKWHEVDNSYLEHPATKSLSFGSLSYGSLSYGLIKWRSFFQEIGITDFVQVVQVDKSVADISLTISRDIGDTELISPRSTAKDWESIELVHLLSLLSTSVDRESCKYLLEILDTLWEDCYSAKTIGYCNFKPSGDGTPFKSSFLCNMQDIQWAVSSMDTELHYPKDLFHDCKAVRSIFGASAPYVVPKVKSEKLSRDIGFKTEVTMSDILHILKVWISYGTPFKASIAQMSRFYTFIWNEMAASKHEISEELLSGPFLFVPYTSGFRHKNVVSGVFLSSEEVYWHDSTGTIDLMKEMQPRCSSIGVTQLPLAKNLCNVYPGLHEFFVKKCGVHESPSFRSYLEIMLELSTVALPSQAANAVFQVFLRWAEAMKSGLLNSEDVVHMKDSLVKLEYTVLPTTRDKWVSLHPSFGLVCWCDDKKLRNRFRHLDSIDFIYFGELGDHEQELLQTKVSILMQTVGIPALSEVVTREAIYYGLVDGSFKYSLVNWALPYAQRYIFSVHPDKYYNFKQFGFDTLNHLQIVVVEKLCYRNVIKNNGSASETQFNCSCLLQGNVLYTTQDSDSHALYMELSCLFFDGNPELHLANFLHMITTMLESGSAEEQMEFFILNSQKVLKLPVEESIWSLPPSLMENDESIQTSLAFSYAGANCFKTQAAVAHPSRMLNSDDDEDFDTKTNAIDATFPIGNELAMNIVLDPADKGPEVGASKFNIRDRLNYGTPNVVQALQTGKDGELAAFKHFTGLFGKKAVKWVNEINETGLPFDIVIEETESEREYIEVKATKSARKDWFNITVREWQFAVEKGETFSVARVILSDSDAKVTVYKNPVKLCQQGKLQLVVMMPR